MPNRRAGSRGAFADGLESDGEGRVYMTALEHYTFKHHTFEHHAFEHHAVVRCNPDGLYETVVADPRRLWPDTLSLAEDGYLYITANQPYRQPNYHNGQDLRAEPYSLFRTRVDATPVRLR